jgi:hypothetical protein
MKQNFVLCPVCKKHKFPLWEDNGTCICPHCGWGHDTYGEENPGAVSGPNDLSLHDYKLRYEYYLSMNPKYFWSTDHYPEIPQIEKSLCPVCKKFQFEPLSWDDIYCGVVPSDVYCMQCGWHYDPEQVAFPNRKDGANKMSLSEYKTWYVEKVSNNPAFNYFDKTTDAYIPQPHKCPVCGKYEFEDDSCHDICPFCGWEDDGVQFDDADYEGGANTVSLNQYRKQYQVKVRDNPNYRWDKKQ